MITLQLVELVRDLNTQVYEQTVPTGTGYEPFEFMTNGEGEIIAMFGQTVWSSEDNPTDDFTVVRKIVIEESRNFIEAMQRIGIK